MSKYKPGQVWEDGMHDEWVVNEDGLLDCEEAGWFGFGPEYVATSWPPLTLIKDIIEDHGPVPDPYKGLGIGPCWITEGMVYPTKDAKTPMLLFEIPESLIEKMDPGFVNKAVDTYEEALSVLLSKNADYGSRNISESPGGALNGLRVRMWDKMARINNLIDSGATPENESLRDSFLDLLNYSAIALMVLDGNWPGMEEVSSDQSPDD